MKFFKHRYKVQIYEGCTGPWWIAYHRPWWWPFWIRVIHSFTGALKSQKSDAIQDAERHSKKYNIEYLTF